MSPDEPRSAAELPGRLIIVEGIDGSGKSTQLDLLRKWLINQGYLVIFSEWNSSPIVKSTTRRGKRKQLLSPMSFSLIHAADFASRTYSQIMPALQSGAVVLADRYVYTAYVRDAVRGVDRTWLRLSYSFAVPPTLAFYFDAPLEEAMKRISIGRPELKYYEAGLDLGLSGDPFESFRLFQGLIRAEYEVVVKEFGLVRMDATESLIHQQQRMREIVRPYLDGALRQPNPPPEDPLRVAGLLGHRQAEHTGALGAGRMIAPRFYGARPPGIESTELPGRLIVIEGTDGVGRSTHVALLKEWLEARGYAVVNTGLRRSELAGRGIERAKRGNTLDPLTLNLLYATDFWDRLERQIMPALRAGMVALVDRYIFSLMARARVRGLSADWVENLYGFALVPDLVVYLDIDIEHLVPRVLTTTGFDYWESGQDYLPDPDVYKNYVEHQTRLLAEFRRLATEHGFTTVDARGPVPEVFRALADVIEPVVQDMATFERLSPASDGVASMPRL